ncbi:hypothetical protein D9M70_589270 [compost metagenome]
MRSAAILTCRPATPAIFCRAEARASGSPEISAPSLSASYSRVRLTAICTSMAATGARKTISKAPMPPSGLSLLLPPPKNRPNCAKAEMAPAKVAVMVMVSVSRLRI